MPRHAPPGTLSPSPCCGTAARPPPCSQAVRPSPSPRPGRCDVCNAALFTSLMMLSWQLLASSLQPHRMTHSFFPSPSRVSSKQITLLSDGSVTRHLQLMTGLPVSVDCLEMRGLGDQREGLPPGAAAVPGPLLQRQVLLRLPDPLGEHPQGRAYVYAASWWNAATVDSYLRYVFRRAPHPERVGAVEEGGSCAVCLTSPPLLTRRRRPLSRLCAGTSSCPSGCR